jgi:hypothetical protein
MMDLIVLEERMEIKEEERRRKNLYDKFQELKEAGQLPKFEDLDRETLVQLWFYEGVTDSSLSELFSVDKKEVTKKRKEYGITIRSCIFELMCEVEPEMKKFEKLYLS